jgi:hypothetical protein
MKPEEFEEFVYVLLQSSLLSTYKIEPSLNHEGKTTKGKFDALAYDSNEERYVAILCTTQKSALKNKIIGDLEKAISSPIAGKIRKIFVCINSPVREEVDEYRELCKSQSWELIVLSLEGLVDLVMTRADLLKSVFQEEIDASENDASLQKEACFDCGHRLKMVRLELGLSASETVELLGIQSERIWKAMEEGIEEVPESALKSLQKLSSVSMEWLKHGRHPKYPCHKFFGNLNDLREFFQATHWMASYALIDPRSMRLAFLAQRDKFCWDLISFETPLDVWAWFDDQHKLPGIFAQLQEIQALLDRPYGRIVSGKQIDQIIQGDVHPSVIAESSGGISYWFEDLLDSLSKPDPPQLMESEYGKWFELMHNEFRRVILAKRRLKETG